MNKDDSLLKSKTDWNRLNEMSEEDIDLSDIPELTDEQFQAMRPAHQVLAEKGIPYNPPAIHYITVYHEDGSQSTHPIAPHGHAILLDPDVQVYFPDSESVNRALRTLIESIPQPL